MPVPRIDVLTSRINRVLVRELGWVQIQPGTLKYTYVTYKYEIPDSEPQHSGYEYPAFEYVTNTGEFCYIQSDNIIGIELLPEEGGSE